MITKSEFVKLHIKKKSYRKIQKKILTGLRKHGEDWHREINTVVNNLEVELGSNVSSQQSYLNEQENEFSHTITQMKQRMVVLKKIFETKNDKSALAYKSANVEFKKYLPEIEVSFSEFCNQMINREQLKKQFGYLIETKDIIPENRNPTNFVDVNQYPKCQFLLDKPQIIACIDINTQSQNLCSISCMSDENLW